MNFHIIMATLNPGVTIKDFQAHLGGYVSSYYRIAPNVWVVVGFLDAATLAAVLNPLISPGGNLFVTRIDPTDNQGMMMPAFWIWLQKHRGD